MAVLQVPVSRLSDLLRLVADELGNAGDGTTYLVGKKYLAEFGAGSPPRVLFVPEVRGKLGPATKLNAGYVASMTHACTVYVRGAEDGTDMGQFDAACGLGDRVMNALKMADPGHVTLAPGNPRDESPLPDNAYGADVAFEFTYQRPVARDVAVLRPGLTSISPPDPDRPQGGNGKTYTVPTSGESPTRP